MVQIQIWAQPKTKCKSFQATTKYAKYTWRYQTKYFWSLVKYKRMVLQACLFIFSQSLSDNSAVFSSKAIFNSCWTKTSITLHCHMPKLFVSSNFSTSNFALETIIQTTKGFVKDHLTSFFSIIRSTYQSPKSPKRTNSNA